MPKKRKWIVYLDMDGPTADFDGAIPPESRRPDPKEMFEIGFFLSLKVVPGAREAIEEILAMPHIKLYIATKPSTKNLWSTIEKYLWVEAEFPPLLKRIFLTCDKGHLNGDFLIDDDLKQWGKKFKGEFIHFDTQHPEECWKNIVRKLKCLS